MKCKFVKYTSREQFQLSHAAHRKKENNVTDINLAMLGIYFKFNIARKLTKRKNTSNKIKLWETDGTGQ